MNNTTGQTPGLTNTASGAEDLPEARLFTKKPVTISATQWFKNGDHPQVRAIAPSDDLFFTGMGGAMLTGREKYGVIGTLESPNHLVTPGDWIITGVAGEHYACKPDIFEATYSPAALAAGQSTAAQAVAEPAEWPTNEMIDAGRKAAASQGRLLGSGQSLWHVFRAMLAAAPAQPVAQHVTAYAALPEYGINTASHAHFRVLGFTADQMRAFADATHTLRASHGEAPAGAGETPWRSAVLDLIDECPGLTMEQDRWLSRRVKELEFASAPRPMAHAEDSVQEDAALWHWLAEYLVGTRTDLDDEIVASETVNDLRKLVEAAIKQGEPNDR